MKRYLLVSPGKIKSAAIADLLQHYTKLLSRDLSLEVIELRCNSKDDQNQAFLQWLQQRQNKVSAAVQKIVILNERGQQPDSVTLSKKLSQWKDQGIHEVIFAIGSDREFSSIVTDKSHWILSLSNMITTHEIAHVFLAEQLYRSHTIQSGHPYHRQ